MKHTPGPWTDHQTTDELGTYHDISLGDTTPICTLVDDKQYPNNSAEVKANAALIAAAPDLLAALKDLVDAVETRTGDWLNTDGALEAISKAEGETDESA